MPQIRPIEKFGYILIQKTYKNGWDADNLKDLKEIILLNLRQTPILLFSNLLANVKTKVRKSADMGPDSLS